MLGPDLTAALPELRAAAESRMTAVCTITRDGTPAWDPVSKQETTTPTVVYPLSGVGVCRIKRAGQQDAASTTADQVFVESQYILSLPVVGSEGVMKDDVVTVTACPEDAALVGRKFDVVARPVGSPDHGTPVPGEDDAMTGFDELGKLALDLTAAPVEAIPNIAKAVGISALKGKKAWQAAARGHKYSGSYPASIDYDTAKLVGTTIQTDVGPNLDRGVGTPGLGIVEDSPGGVKGTPQRNYVKAEEVMAPDLEKGVAIAIDQALKAVNL